ncbi:MAG: hypothetical protein FJ037_06955 [Chloroflexi bacterium]|nr:hypothetical protein [Chloroflexota bacterium]
MRFQRLALTIAAGAMLFVLAAAGSLIARERTDAADRSARTAALEVGRVQAVIQARAEALSAVAQALVKDPEVAQWATGGRPPAWYTGAPREAVRAPGEAVADYVLFVGPGPSVVGQKGAAAPPPLSGPNLQRAPQRSLVAEAQTGNIIRFADAPAVTASARSHTGTDAVGVATAILLDRAELDAIGRLLGREVKVEWRPTGDAPARAEVRVDGVHDVATGRLDQVVDGEVLVALVSLAPGQAGNAAGQRGLLIATGVLAAAAGMGGVLLMLRVLASRLDDLGDTLAAVQPELGDSDALERLEGKDEVGRVAASTMDAFRQLRGRTDAAVEEARVATARQLLGEHVIRSMEEGVIVERPDTVCIVCNPAAVGLLDVTLADLIGERGTVEHALGSELYAALVKRAREEPEQPPFVMTWGARDLVFDSYEVPDVRGDAMNIVVIIRDVTAVLETERLKRDLVSIVSHELRTPLTVLTSALEMIVETAPPEQRAIADTAQRNVARMRDMVNDLLDLARLESGQAEIEPRELDLVALCQETASLLGPQAQAKQTGISVHTDRQAIVVECAPRHLGRAITNLASNAVKFTPAGGHVWIEAGVEDGRAFVNVIDNGPGIPAAEQSKIFNRFFRASNTRSQVGGTGLGLAIVAQIMEMHGGAATLVHYDASGSRFRLEWPARAPHAIEARP